MASPSFFCGWAMWLKRYKMVFLFTDVNSCKIDKCLILRILSFAVNRNCRVVYQYQEIKEYQKNAM